jgi:ribosomal protein S18 acetylase RimI-like enzyme
MAGDRDLVRLRCTREQFRPSASDRVRWLDWDRDYVLASAFWPPDLPLTRETWDEARVLGYHYCAIVEDDKVASIAAEWRYADDAWEVAAVGTAPAYRRRGYARSVVSFVTAQILDAGRVATCTTGCENIAMVRTAESVGFQIEESAQA